MPRITLRLFGLGKGDASKETLTRTIEPGTTVAGLWESLRRQARPGEKLTVIDARGLLALVNGRPLRTLEEWNTEVVDGDTVVYMPKAFGG